MTTTRSSYLAVAGVSLLLGACQVPPGASQSAASAPPARVVKFQLRPDPLAN